MTKTDIILKCYECTAFQWWEINHPERCNSCPEKPISELFYAVNERQAKYMFIRQQYGDTVSKQERNELWMQVRARRKKSEDFVKQPEHEIIKSLSDTQLNKMKHAVGFDSVVPQDFKEFYRNRYIVPYDPDWNDLIYKKLALKSNCGSMNYLYYLTDAGIKAMLSLLPVRRKDIPVNLKPKRQYAKRMSW